MKLQNCLIDTDGFISIIDFGVATELPEGTDIVPNPGGRVIGTLPYMSPEMLGGKDHNVKTDWWSVGVIAYEMAHGKYALLFSKILIRVGAPSSRAETQSSREYSTNRSPISAAPRS